MAVTKARLEKFLKRADAFNKEVQKFLEDTDLPEDDWVDLQSEVAKTIEDGYEFLETLKEEEKCTA